MEYNVLLVFENFPDNRTSFYQFIIDDVEMFELKKCHNNFVAGTYEDLALALLIGYEGNYPNEYYPMIWMIDFFKRRKPKPIKTKNPPIIDSGSWVIINTGFLN